MIVESSLNNNKIASNDDNVAQSRRTFPKIAHTFQSELVAYACIAYIWCSCCPSLAENSNNNYIAYIWWSCCPSLADISNHSSNISTWVCNWHFWQIVRSGDCPKKGDEWHTSVRNGDCQTKGDEWHTPDIDQPNVNKVRTPFKSASKTHTQRFVRSSKIFVWGA